MRILWTLIKIIVGLAIVIPLGIVALGLAFGVFGMLLGLAVLALKLACIGLVGYGMFRAAKYFFGPAPKPVVRSTPELPAPDRYYEAAMRELDAEMRGTSGR